MHRKMYGTVQECGLILYILCRLRLRSVQFNEYETSSIWITGICGHEEHIDSIAMMLIIIIRILMNAVAYRFSGSTLSIALKA